MNPFQQHINVIFQQILEIRHSSSMVNMFLKQAIDVYIKNENIDVVSVSGLVISDWTSADENGYKVYQHTGATTITKRANLEESLSNMLSNEFALSIARSFELSESFLKNCLFEALQLDSELVNNFHKTTNNPLNRANIPSDQKLILLLKKAMGPKHLQVSKKSSQKFGLKEYWTVISNVRHAIIHSQSQIKKNKIEMSKTHIAIFKLYFSYNETEETYHIQFDGERWELLLRSLCEFNFQIFKLLSDRYEYNWDFLETSSGVKMRNQL